jgi:hypothetical protein
MIGFLKVQTLFLFVSFCFSSAFAALPPQFYECMGSQGGTKMSVTDLREISKVSPLTICQNQLSLLNKYDTGDLIKNGKVSAGISVAKSSYLKEDLLDIAKSGSYVLYVDSAKLEKMALIELMRAGVQVVVMTAASGLSVPDMMEMARAKPFIVNVDSIMLKEDLRNLVSLGTQVVIRSNQANLTKDDIIYVAKVNSDLVTILP